MKYSLGIANFLEVISSISHSIVFLYFFIGSHEQRTKENQENGDLKNEEY